MKQLLFLLLFPCFALAQYQGNANQKITLGEQTTADGLVWRGRLADTANLLANKLDTSVYIVLDTGTRAMWYYQASTTPKWTRLVDSLNNLQGQLSLTSKVTGVLPLDNGGTGSTTQNFVDLTTTQSIGGAKTFTSAVTATRFNPTENTATGTGMYLSASNTLAFSTNGTRKLVIDASGNIGIGTTPSPYFTSMRAIDIGNNVGITRGGSGEASFTYNAYVDIVGATRYKTDAPASSYEQWQGEHRWFTSGRGVTNNTVNYTQVMTIDTFNRVGIGQNTPLAVLHLKAGTASVSSAPLKFTSGTNLTTAEAGAMEFNGTNLFFSPSTTRHTVNHGLTGSATLDFPSTTTLLSADLTITVTGVSDGDVVSLGVPNAAVNANTCYTAWVSSANTVTVRFNNYSSGTVNPASGTFKVFVTK